MNSGSMLLRLFLVWGRAAPQRRSVYLLSAASIEFYAMLKYCFARRVQPLRVGASSVIVIFFFVGASCAIGYVGLSFIYACNTSFVGQRAGEAGRPSTAVRGWGERGCPSCEGRQEPFACARGEVQPFQEQRRLFTMFLD